MKITSDNTPPDGKKRSPESYKPGSASHKTKLFFVYAALRRPGGLTAPGIAMRIGLDEKEVLALLHDLRKLDLAKRASAGIDATGEKITVWLAIEPGRDRPVFSKKMAATALEIETAVLKEVKRELRERVGEVLLKNA